MELEWCSHWALSLKYVNKLCRVSLVLIVHLFRTFSQLSIDWKGESLWIIPITCRESKSIWLLLLSYRHTRATISWAFLYLFELDPYVGLSKNGKLGTGHASVIWFILVKCSQFDSISFGYVDRYNWNWGASICYLCFMSGNALFFFGLEIITLLILSTTGFCTSGAGGLKFEGIVSGWFSSSEKLGAANVTLSCSVLVSRNSLLNVPFFSPGKGVCFWLLPFCISPHII